MRSLDGSMSHYDLSVRSEMVWRKYGIEFYINYKELLAYIEGMRACCESMDVSFEDPRREALAIQGAGGK